MIYRITFEFPVGPPEVSVRQYSYIGAADATSAARKAHVGQIRHYPGWKVTKIKDTRELSFSAARDKWYA